MMNIVLSNPQCKWMKKTKEVMERYNIYDWELAGMEEDKRFIKYTISERVKTDFHRRMTTASEGKSKMTHFFEGKGEWTPEEPAEYMNKLTRKQASTIFKARTRMTKVKNNYKNGYTDLTCRACKREQETQSHALIECPVLHPHGRPTNSEIDPFSKEINVLKVTARNIETIMQKITEGSMGMLSQNIPTPPPARTQYV